MFFLFALHHVVGLDNGLGLTPPMGYNAYDHVGCCADETTLKAQGAALIATGLAKLGFVYVNADCGWMGGRRSDGTLYENEAKFPSGMAALAKWMHARGLKLGLYSDRGTKALPLGEGTGMYGHESADAVTLAGWGVDYLKVDDMSGSPMTEAGAFADYARIRDALNATGRAIFYSTCGHSGPDSGHWGEKSVVWMGPKCSELANACRVTQDVRFWGDGRFGSDKAVNAMASYGGFASFAGAWPDPDLLFGYHGVGPNASTSGGAVCGGAGKLEYCTGSFCDPIAAHSITQFRLWAVLGAPLLLSMDIATLDAVQLATYANSEIIAVSQDADESGRGTHGGRRVSGGDLVGPGPPKAAAGHPHAPLARGARAAGAGAKAWPPLWLRASAAPAGPGPNWFGERAASKCDISSFPFSRVGMEAVGLQPAPNASSAAECLAQCCAMGTAACRTWQWAPAYDHGHGVQRCWVGIERYVRLNDSDWIAGGATTALPPTPAPPSPLNTQNVWARNLHDGSTALIFVNNGASATPEAMACDAAFALAAGLVDGVSYAVRDVGSCEDLPAITMRNGFDAPLAVAGDGGSLMLRLTPRA